MSRSVLVLLLCLLSSPAWGWGPEGHRIVATLAEAQLRPEARAEARRLLAGEPEPTLAGIASWADEIRKDQAGANARWHYVNFQGGDCAYVPPRDCPDGQCIVAAINRNFLVLSDRTRPDAERRDALKYLVHFVGDVHQPLHASARKDKGGNDHQVSLDGKGSNLHSVWDRVLLASRGLESQAHVKALSKSPALPADPSARSDRPAVEWALESCRIVRDGDIYPKAHQIDQAYLQAHRPRAELRLRQAGARLAAMINFALAR